LHEYARLLPEQFADSGVPGDELLTEMHDGVVRLSELAESLVRFSGGNRLHRRFCFLQDVVEQALAAVEPEVHRRGVVLECRCVDPLPAAMLDASLLRAAFSGVLRALGRTLGQGGRLAAEVRRQGTDGLQQCVRFESTDSGVPRAPMEPQREAASSESLGLVLAHRIVLAHDGHLQVGMVSGVGEVITVTLPVRLVAERRSGGLREG
jgi:signal transduction histidine kinase